jgi:tRNA A-37 threonylcarbamoyl transferase component Bud32
VKAYHDDAQSLWSKAGSAQAAPPGARDPGTGQDWLLKTESRVRILLSRSGPDGLRVVSKIYRTPVRLAWRTLFMTSRAKREYHNLVYAFDKGLRVVQPLGWSDTRRLGCVRYNQLSMVYTHGQTLIHFMKQPSLETLTRESVFRQAGELLAGIHKAGIAWGTALPRNIMVSEPAPGNSRPCVAAFDFPYAFCSGRDIRGSRYALTDLWWMADDWLTRDGFDDKMLDLFYSAYAGDGGVDPKELRQRVEQLTKRQIRLNRYRVRVVQAFRLNKAA